MYLNQVTEIFWSVVRVLCYNMALPVVVKCFFFRSVWENNSSPIHIIVQYIGPKNVPLKKPKLLTDQWITPLFKVNRMGWKWYLHHHFTLHIIPKSQRVQLTWRSVHSHYFFTAHQWQNKIKRQPSNLNPMSIILGHNSFRFPSMLLILCGT